MNLFRTFPVLVLLTGIFSCSAPVIRDYENTGRLPEIFPDYTGTTIPVNIAPLNFMCMDVETEALLLIEGTEDSIKVASSGTFKIPERKWKELLKKNQGKKISLTVFSKSGGKWEKYNPFTMAIAPEPIDPYFAYRLIEPGYAAWHEMGIYQRNLEGFKESPIYENRVSHYNCVNCHSFNMQNPEEMLFHIRGGPNSGTPLIREGKIEQLNTQADTAHTPLIYPSWHPSGKFVAFSVNKIRQAFYANNQDRVEVYDMASDVVVYDLEHEQILTAPHLSSKDAFETFPSFSPDGKTFFFCSAPAVSMPERFDSVRYNLCAVSFDPVKKTFGEKTDTLYNARLSGGSATFPRASPDGRYLLYTVSDFGNFHIWHKEADLRLLDLETGEYADMGHVNSEDVESYHSWSSNSRWFIFSSRRIDGLYTRPYIAYLGENGEPGKPFLVPQRDPAYYDRLMKSFNIPEMIKGKVKINPHKLVDKNSK